MVRSDLTGSEPVLGERHFKILNSISCKARSLPVESDKTIRFAILLRVISAYQILPEVNVLCRKWILKF